MRGEDHTAWRGMLKPRMEGNGKGEKMKISSEDNSYLAALALGVAFILAFILLASVAELINTKRELGFAQGKVSVLTQQQNATEATK
jgi:hypothetical protein